MGLFTAITAGLLGIGVAKGRRAQKRMNYENMVQSTRTAYATGESIFSANLEKRANALRDYEFGLASARARQAAGGGLNSGSWDAIVGQLASKRDEALSEADTQIEAFKQSESWKFIQDDYARMAGLRNEGGDDYYIYKPQQGVSGESLFTKEQQKMLRSYQGGDSRIAALYENYYRSVVPTEKEYMRLRFGTEQERRKTEAEITQRIKDANARYDESLGFETLNNSRGYY